MDALRDINASVKRMQKSGQDVQDWQNYSASKVGKGMLRGAKETIPGLVDFFVGNGAGIVSGVGNWMTGGSFVNGFDRSKNFVKNWYSDPIRKLEMSLGGNKVRDIVNKGLDAQRRSLEESAGPKTDAAGNITPQYQEYLNGLALADKLENYSAFGSELAFSAPAFGGPVWKAVPKAFSRMSGRTALRLGGGAKAARTAMAVGKQIPRAGFTADLFAPGMVESHKENSRQAAEALMKQVDEAKKLDPSSELYRKIYASIEKNKNMNPEAFASLKPPSAPVTQDQADKNKSTGYGTGFSGWWDALPQRSKSALTEGAGGAGIGALLGLLFGGKGATWKMALLGSLLGGLHGGGGMDWISGKLGGIGGR